MRIAECLDVTIIGGGPAGLYAAFYSGLREMKTKIIDAQPQLGGKLHIYPEKMIWDVGGQTPITGASLIDQLVEQGLTFQPEVVLNEKITSISRNGDDLFVLQGTSGQKHVTKTVIVAVGSGILKPQKLQFKGQSLKRVSNLHYTVRSLQYFKDKVVIVSGGGNSAIDWANTLEPAAKKVYVTHRKAALSGHESQVTQLLNSSVECFFNTTITNLLTVDNQDIIGQVELTNHATGEVFCLVVDEVLVNHGFEQDASLLKNSPLDIEMIEDFYIAGNATSESSVPGLYAAGDILKYEGKLNLIAGAFQDAANAVNKAKQYIQPGAMVYAMVSSHNEVFDQRNREIVKRMLE